MKKHSFTKFFAILLIGGTCVSAGATNSLAATQVDYHPPHSNGPSECHIIHNGNHTVQYGLTREECYDLVNPGPRPHANAESLFDARFDSLGDLDIVITN